MNVSMGKVVQARKRVMVVVRVQMQVMASLGGNDGGEDDSNCHCYDGSIGARKSNVETINKNKSDAGGDSSCEANCEGEIHGERRLYR